MPRIKGVETLIQCCEIVEQAVKERNLSQVNTRFITSRCRAGDEKVDEYATKVVKSANRHKLGITKYVHAALFHIQRSRKTPTLLNIASASISESDIQCACAILQSARQPKIADTISSMRDAASRIVANTKQEFRSSCIMWLLANRETVDPGILYLVPEIRDMMHDMSVSWSLSDAEIRHRAVLDSLDAATVQLLRGGHTS